CCCCRLYRYNITLIYYYHFLKRFRYAIYYYRILKRILNFFYYLYTITIHSSALINLDN
ncbi:hypothetical protein K469DRAFT_605282, partial [Zopfia rhizophila CBS 207.26]